MEEDIFRVSGILFDINTPAKSVLSLSNSGDSNFRTIVYSNTQSEPYTINHIAQKAVLRKIIDCECNKNAERQK